MKTILIKNVVIVNEGVSFNGFMTIKNDIILEVAKGECESTDFTEVIDGKGKLLIPGVIDDQVHFRDPGLTRKGDIETESRAAVAGGITSYMEMPNVIPQTTTIERLEDKYKRAEECSLANYSFYLGGTNDNADEVAKLDPTMNCGVKVFMGSSTGNMLVDKPESLKAIFSKAPSLIAVHCEDEETIIENTRIYKEKYGEDVPISCHPDIRSVEACYKSSSLAVRLAKENNSRLHVLHLTSEKEMSLFESKTPRAEKKITAEVCVHHLWFEQSQYDSLGTNIKWNPAIKSITDRDALREALISGKLDVVATDHAPHTKEEKKNTYFKAPSGGPLVQHSLQAMIEMYKQGVFTLEMVIDRMCHAPADIYKLKDRGYLRAGYKADFVIVDLNDKVTVSPENIAYKCGWSPFEGTTLNSKVTHTFVNGNMVYNNEDAQVFNKEKMGERLEFNY